MNKLVSKNPVLRFKQGKKILKFKDPSGPIDTRSSNEKFADFWKGMFSGWNPYTGFVGSNSKKQELKVSTDTRSSRMVTPSLEYKLALRNYAADKYWKARGNDSEALARTKAIFGNTPTITKKATSVRRQSSTPKSGWSYGFDRSKEGIGDIAAMQRKLKAEGYYADDENSRDDGKWGLSTENAYQRYLKKLKAMELPSKVQYIQNPIKVTPQPTPDFGYKTNNTYDNINLFRDNLNQLGINSNESLIGFMNKGRNGLSGWGQLFYNDVDKALGGVYNDDTVRRVFNTQGNWGRGFLGKGDYSDLLGSLGTYAGSWNGAYDRAKELYEANRPKLTPQYMQLISNWFRSQPKEPIQQKYDNQYNLIPLRKYFKQGGLISKDPILRFKRNFRKVAQ